MDSGSISLRLAKTWLLPRWGEVLAAALCAIWVALITALIVYGLDPVIKAIFGPHHLPFRKILWVPLLFIVAGIARALGQIGQAIFVNRVGHAIVGDIQLRLFSRLVRADLAYLQKNHTGSHLSSVLYDAGLIREGLTTGVINYTQNLLQVIATFAVMAYEDWLLTLIVLSITPIAALVMRRFNRRTRKAADGAMTQTSALSTAIMESLDGIKVVKIDNREAFEEKRISEVIHRRQFFIIKGANAKAAAAPVTEALTSFIMAAILVYAAWRGLGLGPLMVFLGALGVMSQSLRQLANLQTVMIEGVTAAKRLFLALDVAPQIINAPEAKALVISQADIVLNQVTFSYGDQDHTLKSVSLSARRGEVIALVGPSGSGKTTLLHLIPRFYEAKSGQILIDNQDIRSVSLESLRSQMALVTQEPFLFDDTVYANIAYARPDAAFAEVVAAAKAAAAHDFITRLPDGYQSLVGEAGTRLSGGQKQRIAIARAFLKNAPILLLDEATSALDTESEAQIQKALARLMEGRTTLMIAHRLSTVRQATRIYVLVEGKVVEVGNHQDLIQANGVYARLARTQSLDLSVPSLTPHEG